MFLAEPFDDNPPPPTLTTQSKSESSLYGSSGPEVTSAHSHLSFPLSLTSPWPHCLLPSLLGIILIPLWEAEQQLPNTPMF